MKPGRVYLGRDVDVICETRDGVELAGPLRLRPGFVVDLITARPNLTPGPSRPALVMSWWIRGVGSSGPRYRGFCRWDPGTGNELPTPKGHVRPALDES